MIGHTLAYVWTGAREGCDAPREWTVQRSRPGRPVVELLRGDEQLARIAFALHAMASRRGTFVELIDPTGETVDAVISERAHPTKAAGRRPVQPSLF